LKKINKKNDLNIDKLQRKIYNLTQKKWGIKLNLGWGIKLNLDICVALFVVNNKYTTEYTMNYTSLQSISNL